HRDRAAGRDLSELLLRRRVADLGAAGHADHDRRRPGHRARRGAGDRAACRPARRPHHRAGRDRPRAARGPAVRVPRERGPGQRGHGRARRGGLRRDDPDQHAAGGWPGRPRRDRIRLHHRRPALDAGGGGCGGRRVSRPGRRGWAAWVAGGPAFRPGLAAIGLLVALGTGPTAVAYTLYFRGLRTAAASTAARLALLEPLTGAILAALLLGERLS